MLCLTQLCKRKSSKVYIIFGFSLLLLITNMLMSKMSHGPFLRVGYNVCDESQMDPNIGLAPKNTSLVTFVTSLQDLIKANRTGAAHLLTSVLNVLRNETGHERLIEQLSAVLLHQKQEQLGSAILARQHYPPKAVTSLIRDIHLLSGVTLKVEELEEDKDTKTVCPEESPDLIGATVAKHEELSMDELEAIYSQEHPGKKFAPLSRGGHYAPKECKARQKLAIIIPYRNRYAHIRVLLNNLIPFLQRQQSDFRIFVIEQNLPTTFNRGMLQNVGFLEALKQGYYDCFVFHDVDMLPLNDHCFYRCKDHPIHLPSAISKWNYGLPYGAYFGGVTAFTTDQYKKINGNSNLYFGWGGEDDDLNRRIMGKKYRMIRYPKQIGKYDMIKHKRDAGNNANPDRNRLLGNVKGRQDIEGLTSTIYNVTKVDLKPLVTWIYVSIDMTKVIETAPANVRAAMPTLLREAHVTKKPPHH